MRAKQLVEVVPATAPLQTLVVESETLDDVLAQTLGRPNSELGATGGLHSIADRDDHIEIEILDLITLPIESSCCRICNNWLRSKLALVKNVLDVS